MVTHAEEYRMNAAACQRLAKTMDKDNKLRLQEIAQQWLDLALEEEREFVLLDPQGSPFTTPTTNEKPARPDLLI
jgi:hypothetical protein